MGWRLPGKNFTVEFEGRKVVCRPFTDGQRKEFRAKLVDLPNDSADADAKLNQMLAGYIMSIEGIEGDIATALAHQTAPFIGRLILQIMQGNALSEEEAGNSFSSSRSQQSVQTN